MKIAHSPNASYLVKITAHRELGKYKTIITQLMDSLPVGSGLLKVDESTIQDDCIDNTIIPQ